MQRLMYAAALALAACSAPPPTTEAPAPVPAELRPVAMHEAAPDVPFMDLNGGRHLLSEYQGKTIVLFFYAAGCPISKRTLPKLDEFSVSGQAKGVVVVPIERTGAGPDRVKQFIEQSGTKQQLFYDPSLVAAHAFQIDKQPWVYLVGPNFKVEEDVLGEMSLAAYKNVALRYAVK